MIDHESAWQADLDRHDARGPMSDQEAFEAGERRRAAKRRLARDKLEHTDAYIEWLKS